jgi:ribose/xylose/arabinose/galactoside ABC-type transport system permease subunit
MLAVRSVVERRTDRAASQSRDGRWWVVGCLVWFLVVGLARYVMNAWGWSDRAQVLVIVGLLVVAVLVSAARQANKKGDGVDGN